MTYAEVVVRVSRSHSVDELGGRTSISALRDSYLPDYGLRTRNYVEYLTYLGITFFGMIFETCPPEATLAFFFLRREAVRGASPLDVLCSG
jgi:hypothetical protein